MRYTATRCRWLARPPKKNHNRHFTTFHFCYTVNRHMAATPEHRVSTGERINHEAPGHLQQALGARGIRLTKQRRVLLQVMETARRHLDAAEILERAQKIDPERHPRHRLSHARPAEAPGPDRRTRPAAPARRSPLLRKPRPPRPHPRGLHEMRQSSRIRKRIVRGNKTPDLPRLRDRNHRLPHRSRRRLRRLQEETSRELSFEVS